MKFSLTARVEKKIYSGEYGNIFLVLEDCQKKDGTSYEKKWSVSSKENLIDNESYNFEGYITQKKDPEIKNKKGYPIDITNFTVTKAERLEFFRCVN